MTITKPATPEPSEREPSNNQALSGAIGDYVRAHQRRHGQAKTAEALGVSRHTLWRFLERGHSGRAVPAAVLNYVGKSIREIEAATLEIIIDLEGLRPDPALRPLRDGLEDGLLQLCAAPLTTVDELARLGRVPPSTLRERLDKLAERGLADSVSQHLGALGSRPQRRYFPTEQGVIAAGAATQGREHMLRAYPLSRQWFRLLAERLDSVAVLYRVAAMIADADPHHKPVRVDHYRRGPYDLLLTLFGGRTICLIRQGPALPGSNLRYRLRSIERLPASERPFITLVLTHADQATRRAVRSLGDPTEHRRTFVATEGEPLAGDHNGVVWQQCGGGLGEYPPVEISPDASLPGILALAERLLGTSHRSLRDDPRPDADALYPSDVKAAMLEPARQLASAPATQLTRAAKQALDLLAAVHPRAAGRTNGRRNPAPGQPGSALPPAARSGARRRIPADAHRPGADLPGPPGPGRRGPDPGPLDRPARRLQPPGLRRQRPARPGLPDAPPRRRNRVRRHLVRRGSPLPGPRPLRPAAHPPLHHRLPMPGDQLRDTSRRLVHPGVQGPLAVLPAGVRAPGHHSQAHLPAPGILPTLPRLRLGPAGSRGQSPQVLFVLETPASESAFLDVADGTEDLDVITSNAETLAERGILGEAWILPPPHSLDRRSLASLHPVA